MTVSLPSDPPDPSLALVESIIPATSEFENPTVPGLKFDSRGYSPYIRVTSALLAYLADNRSVAKENMWALRHILMLGQYANDLLSVPETPSGLFSPDVSRPELRRLLAKAHQLSTYLLSTGDDSLHTQVASACTATRTTTSSDALVSFVVDVVNHARKEDTVRDALVLRSVLKHLLASASKADSDQWLNLARRLEKSGASLSHVIGGYQLNAAPIAPQTALAILASITEFAPEPLRMDRYRNEIASDILGVPANRANTAGIVLLRRLAATAPDSESDVVFLPQQRAVNVVKTCQAWVISDEDIDEEVESMITLLFIHMAPILQNVAGNHWEFIFDVIENNLEVCNKRTLSRCSLSYAN
jgi:E3 ubiquitin-protein ligase listerin